MDEDTGQFSPLVILAGKGSNITVSAQEMSVGLTYVRVSAYPKAVNGAISYDFGFVRILPRLEAKVTGPNRALKGQGPIELHVVTHGKLHDSQFGYKAPNVEFVWSCREDNTTTSNASLPFDSPFGNHTTNKGCFGYDPGILHSTSEQRVLINPDFMISKRTYVFQVLVTQGIRSVIASHKIQTDTNISLAIK